MREWLENPQGELAKLYPPHEAAARFAHLFNKRHERMAEKLISGSELDLFHLTHKSVSEPFLVSGALIRKSDGEIITTLEQIGGSLGTLDGWESSAITDSEGKCQLTVNIRGQEYNVDSQMLRELADEGAELNKEK